MYETKKNFRTNFQFHFILHLSFNLKVFWTSTGDKNSPSVDKRKNPFSFNRLQTSTSNNVSEWCPAPNHRKLFPHECGTLIVRFLFRWKLSDLLQHHFCGRCRIVLDNKWRAQILQESFGCNSQEPFRVLGCTLGQRGFSYSHDRSTSGCCRKKFTPGKILCLTHLAYLLFRTIARIALDLMHETIALQKHQGKTAAS